MDFKNFKMKLIDEEGLITLNVIEKANKFNEWMYKTIKPHCKGKILEIGCGIGNISYFFINDNFDIVLSDVRENYLEIVKKKFKRETVKIDIVDLNFDEKYNNLIGTFDTVFALNVIEHINDDSKAIENCKKLLKENGHLIILVPAYQFLYNNFDIELDHFKRYSYRSLKNTLKENNLRIDRIFSFNLIGILGWYFSGSIFKKKTIPEGQMEIFNKMVFIFKIIDFITFKKIGLSVISFSTKK